MHLQHSHYRTFLINLLFLCAQPGFSQRTAEASWFTWFDQMVGASSTGIYNGVEYIEKHRVINDKHKYFLSDGFLPGSVVYDGQPYFDLDLKYNVYDGLLLVSVKEDGKESVFQLINELVDRFSVADHQFIHVKDHEKQQGFYEVLAENSRYQLLVKHFKFRRQVRNKDFQYYEFENERNKHLLFFEGDYLELDSRNDLIRLFPSKKIEIREYYSSHKELQKKDPDDFMKGLLQKIIPVELPTSHE